MATSRGGPAVRRFMAALPAQIEAKLLPGAARAAIAVVKDEAADRVTSDEVRDALTIRSTRPIAGHVEVRLTIKGQWPLSIAGWLEYGTGAHIIRASEAARAGMTIGRINRLDKAAAKEGRTGPGHELVIGGKFVGQVVHHPGARSHPFLRVSLDVKEAEAIAAAQSYINAHVGRGGITGGDEPTDDSGDDA